MAGKPDTQGTDLCDCGRPKPVAARLCRVCRQTSGGSLIYNRTLPPDRQNSKFSDNNYRP